MYSTIKNSIKLLIYLLILNIKYIELYNYNNFNKKILLNVKIFKT